MFPGATTAHAHYTDLLEEFWDSGLATPHMIDEVEVDDEGKFWAFMWEAMLYRHFRSRGLQLREVPAPKSGQLGPDFAIDHDGQTIWIEAIAPTAEGIPHTYRFKKYGEAYAVPHEAMLLRWTSAIADKAKKLQGYREKGLIGANDPAVIAVNGCQLSDHFFDDNGISQLPVALEAVFPIGPIAVPISPDGKLDGDPTRLPRTFIRKPNNVHVPTTAFLDSAYSHVSAVLGCVCNDMLRDVFPLTVVHNPLALNKLPLRMLGATKEFIADEHGADQFIVRPLD